MKKMFLSVVLSIMLASGVAFAKNQNDQGTSGNNGQGVSGTIGNQGNDMLVGNAGGGNGGGSNGCNGSNCLQIAQQSAVAAPYFTDGGGPGPGQGGSWGLTVDGWIGVNSYAQGTKSAAATAFATGTAGGDGWHYRIATPSFGFGTSGSAAYLTLFGAGAGIGVDKFFQTPDFASVGINYGGFVGQGNGVGVGNGAGTGAGGFNRTRTEFGGGSYVEDHKFGGWYGYLYDLGTPAIAINADGAAGYAAGTTVVGYLASPTSAIAGSKTVGFSGHNGDYGRVWGEGNANHAAVAQYGGAYGASHGSASFCYDGYGNYGAGVAQSSGWTNISQNSNSTTVTSFGSSSSSAVVNGGGGQVNGGGQVQPH